MTISKVLFFAGAACALLAAFGLWAPLPMLAVMCIALGLGVQ